MAGEGSFGGGDRGGRQKDFDSSSWKYMVGRVGPLMRLIAIDPSIRHRISAWVDLGLNEILTPGRQIRRVDEQGIHRGKGYGECVCLGSRSRHVDEDSI